MNATHSAQITSVQEVIITETKRKLVSLMKNQQKKALSDCLLLLLNFSSRRAASDSNISKTSRILAYEVAPQTMQKRTTKGQNQMQEEKNVKWILIVSMILLWISWPPGITPIFGGFLYNLPVYYLPHYATAIELLWYFVNRLHILTFLLTITFTALHHSNIGRKQLFYKLSVYLFIVSMTSCFITFAQMLISLPYR